MTKLEDIVSLAKRRGFVFGGSEIYGGLANTWDYGPLGVELKNNIKKLWWRVFVNDRDDMVGLDGGILMNPKVWEASGHVKNFKDGLVECKKCHKRFTPDKLEDTSKCPECGGEFTKEKFFSGMFKTVIGPVASEGLETYLRPETAQAIFVNYKNVLDSTNMKIPFGIAQIGKAFRNEITTGQFIFRTLEFEQMEIEFFVDGGEWEKWFDHWVKEVESWLKLVGISKKNYHQNDIAKEELAHYSKKTIDFEYKFPFGWKELYGLAYRTDFDLKQHQEHSKKDLEYRDNQTNKKFLPHVIEPTFGLDRTVLMVLLDAYTEEKVKKETRVVLKLNKNIAPVQIAVLPLSKKPKLAKVAQTVFQMLQTEFRAMYDETQSIGKRYRRQDEIGTPYCMTVDFDSLEDKSVTVRDRDSMKQERVRIKELEDYLRKKF